MLDVSPDSLKTIREILKKFVPKARVLVFGSRVEGGARPYSDLDIAIQAPQPIDKITWIRLKEAFEESEVPFRVDCVDWDRLSDEFKAVIQENHEELEF